MPVLHCSTYKLTTYRKAGRDLIARDSTQFQSLLW